MSPAPVWPYEEISSSGESNSSSVWLLYITVRAVFTRPETDGRLQLVVCCASLCGCGAGKADDTKRASSSGPRTEQASPRRQQEFPVRPWGLSGQRGGKNLWPAHPWGEQGQTWVRKKQKQSLYSSETEIWADFHKFTEKDAAGCWVLVSVHTRWCVACHCWGHDIFTNTSTCASGRCTWQQICKLHSHARTHLRGSLLCRHYKWLYKKLQVKWSPVTISHDCQLFFFFPLSSFTLSLHLCFGDMLAESSTAGEALLPPVSTVGGPLQHHNVATPKLYHSCSAD